MELLLIELSSSSPIAHGVKCHLFCYDSSHMDHHTTLHISVGLAQACPNDIITCAS